LGYGICAAQRIPQGTWIGPFQGVPLILEKLQSGAIRNTRHLWEVRGERGRMGYTPINVQTSSWLVLMLSAASMGRESTEPIAFMLEPKPLFSSFY